MPSPTGEEIRKLTLKIARRIHRYLEKRVKEGDSDDLLTKHPLLAKCYAASIRYLSALGLNSGKPLLRVVSPELATGHVEDERTIMGFNLHASVAIEAEDRNGLEQVLRYMGRPPLSKERLKLASDGENLLLTLKSPWRNGTEKIVLSPFNLIERLVALIPQPRKNQIRYHGFFGPNSHVRKEIIGNRSSKSAGKKICRPDFAKLMARVFDIDVLECPRCKSRMQVISFVKDPKAIFDILRSLKMSTAPPQSHESEGCYIEYEIEAVADHLEEEVPTIIY